jgi:PEP-CTERM motif
MLRLRHVLVLLPALLYLLLFQPKVSATTLPLTVSVGYADNIHCADFNTNPLDCLTAVNPNFPNPWQGSSGVVFMGQGITTAPGVPTAFDAGGLLLTNTSGADVNVSDVQVTIGTSSFDLWGSFTVPNGMSVILTQTSNTMANFDTSDTTPTGGGGQCCTNDNLIPKIAINIGGQITTLMDANQILNTGGFDLGCSNPDCVSVNESSPWSLIPGQTATPEPASILLLGSGLLSLGTFVRRKLRA